MFGFRNSLIAHKAFVNRQVKDVVEQERQNAPGNRGRQLETWVAVDFDDERVHLVIEHEIEPVELETARAVKVVHEALVDALHNMLHYFENARPAKSEKTGL